MSKQFEKRLFSKKNFPLNIIFQKLIQRVYWVVEGIRVKSRRYLFLKLFIMAQLPIKLAWYKTIHSSA